MSIENSGSSPWHAGEEAIQTRLGVKDYIQSAASQFIRDFMPDQHRQFFSQLPMLVIGTLDDQGAPWATMLSAQPGFITSPNERTLSVATTTNPDDPAAAGLKKDSPVGVLGIELHTRRRNRMNGHIAASDTQGLSVEVEHSFGNCPKYIQLRDFELVETPKEKSKTEVANDLSEVDRATIAAADTFFVASYADIEDGKRQVDVSHRGGKAGFVKVDDDGVLTIPDFTGNLFFNTLGNIHLNGRAGLLFPDFETGSFLQMTGTAEIDFDSEEIAAFEGAERLWRFRPQTIVRRTGATNLRWKMQPEPWSPNALMTGDWNSAAKRIHQEKSDKSWREFRITSIKDESATIRSFVLSPADGADLKSYQAGQHLPVRLNIPGQNGPTIRTYTLSSAPSDQRYRISVKKEGLFSSHLHDSFGIGDKIEARAPAGAFTIDIEEQRPAVLLAGGVGVTPILSMLREVINEGLHRGYIRPTTVFYAARNIPERAFDIEFSELLKKANGKVRLVRIISDPSAADTLGEHFDVQGQITMDLLRNTLRFDDYEFYMCGPSGFMQAMYDGLRGLNVADKRIHAEAFGPSGLKRTPDESVSPKNTNTPAERSVEVTFAKTNKEAEWLPEKGSLLELAEASGLFPDFGCRNGSCGSCKVKVNKGAVAYETQPEADVGENEALLCCAVPATEGGDTIAIDV